MQDYNRPWVPSKNSDKECALLVLSDVAKLAILVAAAYAAVKFFG